MVVNAVSTKTARAPSLGTQPLKRCAECAPGHVSTRRWRIRQSEQREALTGDVQTTVDRLPAYEELFQEHARRLDRLCRLLLADREESKDVVQEVFLKLFQAHSQPRPPNDWGAWLTRVTVNACRDRRRAGWWPRWWHLTDCVDDMVLPAAEPTPDQVVIARALQQRVWLAFRALSDRQREVFVLRQVEGWSTAAVASALGLRGGSVKRHLFRAVQRLRAAAAGGST